MVMVPITSLLMPILVAAALVFVASSVVWMALPHHKNDYARLPDEDAVLTALGEVPPGQYDFPHLESMDALKSPEVQARFARGPVGFFTVAPRGMPSMGRNLGIWFIYALFVSAFVAYVAGRTVAPGTEYLRVFQITGSVAWAAYGFSHIADAIWFSRPWSAILKQLADAFVYALVTAGAFGWLWPA